MNIMNKRYELVILTGLTYYVICSIITVVYLLNAGDLALPWAPAAFAALLFAAILLGFAIDKSHATIRYIFIALGSYVLIRDILTPFPSISIDNETRKVVYEGAKLIAEILLDAEAGLIALLFTWTVIRFPKFRKFVAVFFVVFLAVDVAKNVVGLVSADDLNDGVVADRPVINAPNVYHMIFDGFSGPFFIETAERLKVIEEFEGFVLFDKVKANHYPTYASMASIMLSEYYSDASVPFNEWIAAWKKKETKVGLLKNMSDHGYALHQYTDIPANASEILSKTKLTGDSVSRINIILAIYAARLSPVTLRQWAMDTVSEYLSWIRYGVKVTTFLDFRAWDSPRVFSTMVSDENKRPNTGQYVFYHGFNPHGPYNILLDCSPTKTESNFNALGCSVNSMVELIRELKSSGKYDDALIVIHSDHGNERNSPTIDGEYFDLEFSRALNRYFWYPESPIGGEIKYLRLTAPLLLVKLPGAKHSLHIDHRELAELVDIGPTIYDATDLQVATKRGTSLFTNAHSSKKEISVFREVLSWRGNRLADGRPKPVREWKMPQLIYRPGNIWELRPAVPWFP
jgi:hypothetical protein